MNISRDVESEMSAPIILDNEDILEAIRDYVISNRLIPKKKSKISLRVLVADTGQDELKYLDGDDLKYLILID